MKKTFLFFGILLLGIGFTKAQNVNIPDNNFKNTLLNNNPVIDTNADGEIDYTEALNYGGMISCGSKNITDLTGIEAFRNITELHCDDNLLTDLDLTQNINLVHFSCDENQLTSLTLGFKPFLEDILCNHNQLSGLDVSQCPVLNFMECNFNQLTSLDITQNTLLEGLSCNNNLLTGINTSQNSVLRGLYCNNNQITSLDMSQNSALYGLYCSNNLLTTLDLGQNSNLSFLNCYNNQISFLNVKNGNNLNIGGDAHFPAFFAYNNANPICIQVDNPTWFQNAYGNADHVDSWAVFSQNCSALAVTEISFKNNLVYPNPTKDYLYITNFKNISGISIYDASGKLIKVEKPTSEMINVSKLKSGVYFLEIITEGKLIKTKIIKN